ncbi:MAG: helix-turn-helix domain-containing protein [Candidatus Paceibacterota bacterium]|jgi:excisionase family DNA binding protein
MTDLPNKALLRPDEVAAYLSLSVKRIYGMIAEGKIVAKKIAGSTIRIPREEVEKLIQDTI